MEKGMVNNLAKVTAQEVRLGRLRYGTHAGSFAKRCQSVDETRDRFLSVLTLPCHCRSHAQTHCMLDGLQLLTAEPLNAVE
jgi:hypothetical protein